jgi:hypothetical protein
MAKALVPARAVAVQGFISWRALAPLPHAPPLDPPACAHEDALMAEEDQERRRGFLQPLDAPQPQASIPATSGAPTLTASGAPVKGLHHAASVHRRAPLAERDRRYVPKEECEAL